MQKQINLKQYSKRKNKIRKIKQISVMIKESESKTMKLNDKDIQY